MKRPLSHNKFGSLPAPENADSRPVKRAETQPAKHNPPSELTELEKQFRERTAELLAINARLAAEIREREQIENALRKSDERYRVLVETIPDVVYGVDATTGKLTFLNLEFETATGWLCKDWIGKPFAELVHPDDLPLALEVFHKILQGNTSYRYELRIRCKDGHYSNGEFISIPQMHNGKVVGKLGIVRDMTKRKQAENALRKSEQIQRAILDGICDPAWMKDKEGVYLAINRAWCLFFGKKEEDVIGKRNRDVFDPSFTPGHHQRDLAVIKSGKPCREEESFPSRHGTSWFDIVITPLFDEHGQTTGTIGIARDITERKIMEEKLLRTQRLESIGSLAGGIAHDLNNILGPIMMSASILRENVPDETRDELILSIQEAAQRGAAIVNQVLTFARGVKGEHKVLEPRHLLLHVQQILKETLPKSIVLSSSLPDGLWNITGDVTQLQQIFVNLCVNARDAMPQGGTLMLKAENCEISKTAAARISGAKPGAYVKVKVIDSGLGISQEIIDKIFDPFFTTKEVGKGTGLGLSTVLGIMKSHGGFITVDSKIGKGSRFSVFFPATHKTQAPVQNRPPSEIRNGNGEWVLVVDDELSICKMVETILSKKGFKTLTAPGGKEALAAYTKHKPRIKAVLTDLAMPAMDGVAFTRKLKEIDPSATVIASTGQSSELRRKELHDLGVTLFLAKPYTADQLLEVVHGALCQNN